MIRLLGKITPNFNKVELSSRVVSTSVRQLDADTVSLSCKSAPKIASSVDATNYIRGSQVLSKYEEVTNSAWASLEGKHYKFLLKANDTKPFNALDGLDVSQLEKVEAICKVVQERCKELGINGKIKSSRALKSLVDLSQLNPDAYEYAIKSDFLIKNFFGGDSRSYTCVKDLSVESLKVIEKGTINDLLKKYVNDSDYFAKSSDRVKELKEFLAKTKTDAPMVVSRAERHTGIFDEVPLDDKFMELKIKFFNFLSRNRTKNIKFGGFIKQYGISYLDKKSNVYEYIKTKKKLSLADAMLMMPYLPKKMQKQVLEKIKDARLIDDRFKSTSLSEEFCDSWLGCSGKYNESQILNKITLAPGTQGRYIRPRYEEEGFVATNGQCEFIINAGKKEIKITDVTYDEEKNLFNISSTLRPLE